MTHVLVTPIMWTCGLSSCLSRKLLKIAEGRILFSTPWWGARSTGTLSYDRVPVDVAPHHGVLDGILPSLKFQWTKYKVYNATLVLVNQIIAWIITNWNGNIIIVTNFILYAYASGRDNGEKNVTLTIIVSHYRVKTYNVDGQVQDCGISNVSLQEILQSCTKSLMLPSLWKCGFTQSWPSIRHASAFCASGCPTLPLPVSSLRAAMPVSLWCLPVSQSSTGALTTFALTRLTTEIQINREHCIW